MPNVIIRSYNTFFDHATGVQFNPVLDQTTGLYIGLATVSQDQVSAFAKNSAYEVLTDQQLSALTAPEQSNSVVADKKIIAEAATLSADILQSAPKPG
jgi:hypothetical protein